MKKIPAQLKQRVGQLIKDGSIDRETVKKIKQANPARKIEFEVGDALQDDFFPQFKTKHWDNECNFSARLVTDVEGDVEEHDKKLGYRFGKKVARFYEKDTGDEDGGFEIDVVLEEKPETNVLTWTIQHKELDFLYQPELTPEEIADGASRPEHVVGSYAVYHKTGRNNKVGGNEYRTGKAFHIYRPYAEDAEGTRVWCDLNIDTKTNEMTVTLPQDFLDAALYPVIVDPTFGYTSVGVSTYRLADQRIICLFEDNSGNPLLPPSTSTVSSIHAYTDTFFGSNAAAKAILINDTDTEGGVTDIIVPNGIGNAGTLPDNDWATLTFATDPTIEPSGVDWYGLGYIHDYSGGVDQYYDNAGDNRGFYETSDNSGGYSSPSDPGAVDYRPYQFSIYATYTASGGTEHTLTVTAATVSITGQSVGMSVASTLTVTAASQAVTGQSVSMNTARTLSVSAVSVAYTGQSVTMTYSAGTEVCFILTEDGDFLLQENSSKLEQETCQPKLNVLPATITITGQSVTMQVSTVLSVTAGTITITGQSVTLGVGLNLSVTAATITITGQSVGMVFDSPETNTLNVLPANLSMTGQSVGMTVASVLTVSPGSISVSGQSVAMVVAQSITVLPATITITGQSVDLIYDPFSNTLTVLPATITIVGQEVIMCSTASIWSPKSRNTGSWSRKARRATPAWTAKEQAGKCP